MYYIVTAVLAVHSTQTVSVQMLLQAAPPVGAELDVTKQLRAGFVFQG